MSEFNLMKNGRDIILSYGEIKMFIPKEKLFSLIYKLETFYQEIKEEKEIKEEDKKNELSTDIRNCS